MIADGDGLIDFVSSVSGEEYLKIEEDLGEGFVRLRVSEAERRQAKHDIRSVEDVVVELLRNSRDAHARRIFVSSSREGDTRTLVVVDDGVGVPHDLHERIFDPRVTSKLETMSTDRWGVHGRGMALYSIKQNVESVSVLVSDAHKGLSLRVVSDTMQLGERADQSTWPVVEVAEDGDPFVSKGPHNIVRRVVEFACDHPDLDVYLGNPTEILTTLYVNARDTVDATDLAFLDDPNALPVWQRPCASADAAGLVLAARGVGLEISERTAHRIMAGELDRLEAIRSQVLPSPRDATPAAGPDIYRDRRGLKLHHADLDEFRRDLHEAFDALGERYFLTLRGEPKVTVGKDEIRVRFSVEKED